MPQVGSFAGFKFGTQESYNSKLVHDANTIYFCYNSGRLFVGDTEYYRPVLKVQSLPEDHVPPNSLYILEKDGVTTLHHAEISDNGDVKWSIVGIVPKQISEAIVNTVGTNDEPNLQFGKTFNIPKISYDNRGFITSAEDIQVKLPDAPDGNYNIDYEESDEALNISKL